MDKEIRVRRKRLSEYTPDPKNANAGSERGQEMIENSLHEVGPGRSLVADRNGILVAGNKTQQGAIDAGLEEVIEVETDGDAIIVHKRRDWDLTEGDGGQARRYAYYDNRASELSMTWSPEQIKLDIEEGVKLDDLFSERELTNILNRLTGDAGKYDRNTSEGQQEKAGELLEKWQVQVGDVFEIASLTTPGRFHRLMCGDSTNPEHVAKLFAGKRADLSVTSPPYGVGKDYEKGTLDDWRALVRGVFEAAAAVSDLLFVNLGDRKTGNENSFHVHTFGEMTAMLEGIGFHLVDVRIWKKPPSWGVKPFWMSTYKSVDEFEFLGLYSKNKMTHVNRLTDEENVDWGYRGVWEMSSVQANTLHSAQFPVELPYRAIRMLTDVGAVVHDPFCGSGTTLEAAESVYRIGYGMEIQPHYTAVCLERMQELGLESRRV